MKYSKIGTQMLEYILEYTEILVEADLRPSAFPFEFFLLLRKEGLV